MPINGPSSWLPVIDEFASHWVQVNAGLAAPLVLGGGYNFASLNTARTALATAMAAYDASGNDRQVAVGNVAQLEAVVRQKIGDFNRAVRAFLANTAYLPALGQVPAMTDAQGKYEKAMDDAMSLWAKINSVTLPAFTPPLILRGGYTQANFVSQVASLKAAYTTATAAGRTGKVLLEQRNAAFDVVEPRLLEYRRAVLASFAPGSPLVLSLPRLSPPRGSTPDGVNATGQWNAAAGAAELQWSAADDAQLLYYSVRMCPGTTYRASEEQVVGTVQPGTLSFSTSSGLVAPGLKAAFKVYVVRSTGNEKGSNAVKVARPVV
jgi:hypothetical protein